MGCTSNHRKIQSPMLDGVIFPKGVLEVELSSAVLLKDTSVIMNMDPYLVLKIGNQIHKSLVHKNQGTLPVFHQKFKFFFNRDRASYGHQLSLSVFDKNIGNDGEIGIGIIDITPIILNKLVNHEVKCHISHDMNITGWVKTTLSFKQQFKGKLFLKPKCANITRKVGLGTMYCSIRLTVGQDRSISRTRTNSPYRWQDTLSVNLLNSLKNGKLSVDYIDGKYRSQICYADLNLQQFYNTEETQHIVELKHNENYAGTITFTTLFMTPQQYSNYQSFIQQKQSNNVDNQINNTSNNSLHTFSNNLSNNMQDNMQDNMQNTQNKIQNNIQNTEKSMNESAIIHKSTIMRQSTHDQSIVKTEVLKQSTIINQQQNEEINQQ